MEDNEYAARRAPALQRIISRREEVRGMSVNMMQRAVLTSFNILHWSF